MTKRRLIIIAALAALAALLAIPAVVMGDPTDITTVRGTIGATYSLTSPDTISLGNFESTNNYDSSNQNIDAYTNDAQKNQVTIVVSDSKTSTRGFMTLNGNDQIPKLANALSVKGGAVNTYSPLTSNQTLASNQNLISGSYTINDFSVRQTITSDDLSKTAGTYSITLTFTATFN